MGGTFTTKLIDSFEPQSIPLKGPVSAPAWLSGVFLSLQSFSLIKLMAEFSLSAPAIISYPAKLIINSIFGLPRMVWLIFLTSSLVFSILLDGGSEVITIKEPLSSDGTRALGTFLNSSNVA